MMKLLRWTLILALLTTGVYTVTFHEDIINYYNKFYGTKDERPVIATAFSPEGNVKYKLPKQLIYRNAIEGMELRAQDTISTDQKSTIQIEFKNGLELLVEENSLIVLDQSDSNSSGELKISFLRGNFKVLNKGKAGLNTIIQKNSSGKVKDELVIDPAGRPPSKPIILTAKPDTNFQNLLKNSKPMEKPVDIPADLSDIENSKIAPSIPNPSVEAKPLEQKDTNKFTQNKIVKRENKETLPDNYIVDVIKKQKSFFNRCYAQHLRVNPEAQGRIDFSFTILPTGKVSDVRVLKSSIPDTRLQQCSVSVIERAEFRPYDGDPIVVNYPVHYE